MSRTEEALPPDVAASPPPDPDQRSAHANTDAMGQGLYLMGRPSLKGFLRYVRNHVANPPADGLLADEWNAARKVISTLEHTEAGAADRAPITKLGPEYEPLLTRLLRDPLIRHGFNTVPTEIALIDLDRLVVHQKHVDLAYVERLVRTLPPAPTREELFRICLPFDHPQPPVQWSRVQGDKFVFISPSNDLRFLGVMPLDPENLADYPPPGDLVGVVGIAVGFGSNFVNVICAEGRMILRNGYHRAYALRRLGLSQVPCIIQHAATRAELEVIGSSELRRDPDLYLKHPRPPMLRDYFHPQLHKVMSVNRRHRVVTVTFAVEETGVPAL